MKLEEQYLKPSSVLMEHYINQNTKLMPFFSYPPELSAFEQRMQALADHPVDRPALARVMEEGMQKNGMTDEAAKNLEAFIQGAPVIIAGQQAGLLTGPLYTVHKAISTLVLAKEASAKLNRPVVPVFWIAGEDHDLAEISHFYMKTDGRTDKLNVPHYQYGKKTASTVELDKEQVKSYLTVYFRSLPETSYSKALQSQCFEFLEASTSYTDFFERYLHEFFGHEGLLYIDAANPALRRYESAYFQKMIEQNDEIAASVSETEARLKELGYPAVMGVDPQSANLFIMANGERVLLQRDGTDFVGNEGSLRFTKEEMLEIAANAPERLSNNVVTRPLMQEMVFPVLSFIGGPGEIAYWAALKQTFELLGMELPVIMPRLGMTIINRQTASLLEKYDLTFIDVVQDGKLPHLRAELYDRHREKDAEQRVADMRDYLERQYELLEAEFREVSKGLQPVIEKNLQLHTKQLDFLSAKLEEQVLLQHQTEFGHYALLEQELVPENSLQERIFTPFVYLNEWGPDLVERLSRLDFKYDKNHKIIYL